MSRAKHPAPPPPQRTGRPGRSLSPWTAVLIRVLSGVLGLAPWLVTGGQLMLQNLWTTEVLPAEMSVSLLPLSQYELTTLVSLMTVGGAVAGLAVRFWRPTPGRTAVWRVAAGVLAVQRPSGPTAGRGPQCCSPWRLPWWERACSKCCVDSRCGRGYEAAWPPHNHKSQIRACMP
jgi:hypothetical protein